MDSVTQVVLGATVAAVCVPAEHRRRAAILGAVLGTLPDLDVLVDYGDAVADFTYHRSFSHSLLVLLPLSVLIWAALRQWWQPVAQCPRQWLWAVALALVTHPLLDAHTSYGTQLLWPLATPPVMWSTIFIIDPLYTLPLLVSCLWVLLAPQSPRVRVALMTGLGFSSAYLGWSWVAKSVVDHQAEVALQQQGVDGIQGARLYSSPAPFNTLVWRVVALSADGQDYFEGYYSFLQPSVAVNLERFERNAPLLDASSHLWATSRLRWFASDFVKATAIDDRLVIADLRMGFEPYYIFQHEVAKSEEQHWVAVESRLLPSAFDLQKLKLVWEKLKH